MVLQGPKLAADNPTSTREGENKNVPPLDLDSNIILNLKGDLVVKKTSKGPCSACTKILFKTLLYFLRLQRNWRWFFIRFAAGRGSRGVRAVSKAARNSGLRYHRLSAACGPPKLPLQCVAFGGRSNQEWYGCLIDICLIQSLHRPGHFRHPARSLRRIRWEEPS